MTAREPFPTIEQLVPHRGSSLMLRYILDASRGELRGVGQISSSSAFSLGGAAPAYAGLDFLAQAAAAMQSLDQETTRPPGPATIGYLVGIREACFESRRLPLDRDLTAYVRVRANAGPMSEYEARLSDGEEGRITAVFSTFRLSGAPGSR